MPSPTSISVDKLLRLIGRPDTPDLIDVRDDDDFAADPRLRARRAVRRPAATVTDWAAGFRDRAVVVLCQHGHKLSEGAAAWLRHAGARAETLEGGHAAWAAAGLPLVPQAVLPPRDAARPHGLGDPRPAQDRPDRLPLADPALRRPDRGLPLRRAGRSRGRRRALRRDALRHRGRGRCSGATAASSAAST